MRDGSGATRRALVGLAIASARPCDARVSSFLLPLTLRSLSARVCDRLTVVVRAQGRVSDAHAEAKRRGVVATAA